MKASSSVHNVKTQCKKMEDAIISNVNANMNFAMLVLALFQTAIVYLQKCKLKEMWNFAKIKFQYKFSQ